MRYVHRLVLAAHGLGGYPLQDAWCWVWLLLGGVCGGVACPGYMYLAIHFFFSGADFLYFFW